VLARQYLFSSVLFCSLLFSSETAPVFQFAHFSSHYNSKSSLLLEYVSFCDASSRAKQEPRRISQMSSAALHNTMSTRTCVTCGLTDVKAHFSKRQWCKGVGHSRCYACVEDPSRAVFDPACVSSTALSNPFGEGTVRVAASGAYSSGPWKGHTCVMKWTKPTFNNGQLPYSTDVYREDMRCIRRTLDFVRAFTATMVTKTQIRVLVPTIHRFDEESLMPNVVYLREPYISGFQKWNSNSGWVNHESEVSPLMCALSHFSYHASGGNNLLCDLQGSWVKTSNLVILTDPVIMTVGPRKFCLPDGGISGMRTFFKKHVCTKYCDPRWILPEEEVRCDDIANGSEGDQRHRYLEALSSRNLVDRAKAVSAKFARGWSTTAIAITTVSRPAPEPNANYLRRQ